MFPCVCLTNVCLYFKCVCGLGRGMGVGSGSFAFSVHCEMHAERVDEDRKKNIETMRCAFISHCQETIKSFDIIPVNIHLMLATY